MLYNSINANIKCPKTAAVAIANGSLPRTFAVMGVYQLLIIVVVLTALLGYVNYRFIKWPPAIGVMVLAMLCSVTLTALGSWVPVVHAFAQQIMQSLHFENILLQIMLGLLLFAGASHINAADLRRQLIPIAALSTLGVFISTAVVGTALYFLFPVFGLHIGYIYCLLFGAVISPTDPIAVLGILKRARIPYSLELKISGESLFNDGVAVVLFITLMELANAGLQHISIPEVLLFFIREAGGGLLYGALLGYAGWWLMRGVDDYKVNVLTTLAIVMGGYALAAMLQVSGPLAMVMAGIIMGNKKNNNAGDGIKDFWELIDELLNAVLFLLLGFELLVLQMEAQLLLIGIIAVAIVLGARWLSVAIPVATMRNKIKFEKSAVAILTWGGLRGGLSVAMALSLPANMYRAQFVSITYVIVVFSVVVQGLTIGKLARNLQPKRSNRNAAS